MADTKATLEEMREFVRQDDLRIMTESQTKQNEKMKPMDNFLRGNLLKDFKKELNDLATTYVEDVIISQKINAVRMAIQLFN